jgi:hypothetical protein
MPRFGPRTRTCFFSLSTCSVVATSALLTFIAAVHVPAIAAEKRDCNAELTLVTSSVDALPEKMRVVVDHRVTKASALSRFHRRDDALAQLDAVTSLLAAPITDRSRFKSVTSNSRWCWRLRRQIQRCRLRTYRFGFR